MAIAELHYIISAQVYRLQGGYNFVHDLVSQVVQQKNKEQELGKLGDGDLSTLQ